MARSEVRSEGLEPPTFRSVARFRLSRDRSAVCQTGLLAGVEDGGLVQLHPGSSTSVVSKSVSKVRRAHHSGESS